jgi:hypothetical protein
MTNPNVLNIRINFKWFVNLDIGEKEIIRAQDYEDRVD